MDATTRQIDWLVDNETKEARRKEWETQGKRELKVKRGVLYRYARDVAVSSRFFVIMASVLRTDGTGPAACKCRCVLRLISDFCDLYDVRYISVKFLKQREKQLLRLECHQTQHLDLNQPRPERPSVQAFCSPIAARDVDDRLTSESPISTLCGFLIWACRRSCPQCPPQPF